MPPLAALYHLSHSGVVITSANIEFELLSTSLRFNIPVLLVQNFIEFLHQPNIHSEQKIRFFQLIVIKQDPIPSWYRHVKILQQLDDSLIISLRFLLEQSHHNLVHFLNDLINLMFFQMSELFQLGRR